MVCDKTTINKVLGCKNINKHYFLAWVKELGEDVWPWFAPLLSDVTPKWLDTFIIIQKVDVYLESWYWLRFICRNISSPPPPKKISLF